MFYFYNMANNIESQGRNQGTSYSHQDFNSYIIVRNPVE